MSYRTRTLLASMTIALLVPFVSVAQTNLAASAPAQVSRDLTDGEVRKIDKGVGKITLKHAEIKNLEMPGMTMVFAVLEPGLLDKVQIGDKVKFAAVRQNGKFVVTEIQVQK